MIWQQLLETNSKCDNKTHQLDQVVGHHVLGAARDDHVRVLLGRDAELLEGGLDEGRVLVQHVLEVSTPLRDVAKNASKIFMI